MQAPIKPRLDLIRRVRAKIAYLWPNAFKRRLLATASVPVISTRLEFQAGDNYRAAWYHLPRCTFCELPEVICECVTGDVLQQKMFAKRANLVLH